MVLIPGFAPPYSGLLRLLHTRPRLGPGMTDLQQELFPAFISTIAAQLGEHDVDFLVRKLLNMMVSILTNRLSALDFEGQEQGGRLEVAG